MDSVKQAVLIGCILGIAFSMIEMIIPDKALFKNVKLIMSIIMLVSIINPFLKDGAVISVSSYESDAQLSSAELQESIDKAYIKEIENKVKKSLELYFLKNEIEADKLVIVTEVDEYNYLEVNKISLYVAEKDRDKTLDLIKILLGENVNVEFLENV